MLTRILSLATVAAVVSAPAPSQCTTPVGDARLSMRGATWVGGALAFRLEGRADRLYILAISDSPGPLVVPLGTLCLGPDPLLVDSALLTGGQVDLRLPIPADPSLASLRIYGQAVVADERAPNGIFAMSNSVDTTITAQGVPPVPLPPLSEPAIQLALSKGLIWFDPSLSGGAHTWVFHAGEVGRAIASYTGDTRTDAALLTQIRHLLTPGKEPTATGGFQDQKQLGSTLMFLLAKWTPRIEARLSTAEKDVIDTIVRAHLVSSAFTSSDRNAYRVHGGRQRTMTGDFNQWVDGNPNYRNGIVGQVVVASLFLGLTEAQQFLASYDHSAFRAQIRSRGLTNLISTFDSPDPNAPTAAEVEGTLRQGYVYHGLPHSDLLGIYLDYTHFTFDRPVSCGALPNNTGILGSNGIVGGYTHGSCSQLPNPGVVGMLTEFDRWDAGGRRVSAHYSNDGWYANSYAHLALLAAGLWLETAESREVLRRVEVGTEDLLFKIDPARGGGYHNFHHGRGYSSPYVWDDEKGHTIHASMLRDVIYRFHGI